MTPHGKGHSSVRPLLRDEDVKTQRTLEGGMGLKGKNVRYKNITLISVENENYEADNSEKSSEVTSELCCFVVTVGLGDLPPSSNAIPITNSPQD